MEGNKGSKSISPLEQSQYCKRSYSAIISLIQILTKRFPITNLSLPRIDVVKMFPRTKVENFMCVNQMGIFTSFLKKWAIPGLFLVHFRSFQHHFLHINCRLHQQSKSDDRIIIIFRESTPFLFPGIFVVPRIMAFLIDISHFKSALGLSSLMINKVIWNTYYG